MRGKGIRNFYKSKLFNFLLITILGVGILFNVIYGSSAISLDSKVRYMKSKPNVWACDHCGNGVCEFNLNETILNCPEDCFLPR